MRRLEFEKARIIIEILSYLLVLIFDLNLFYWLYRSGLDAVTFYTRYLHISLNPMVIFGVLFMLSAVILYVSIKALAIFYITLRTSLYIGDKKLFIKQGCKSADIDRKELDYRIFIQPFPKLTFGKRLRTMRLTWKSHKYTFAYEYLLEPDAFIEYLRKN